MEKKRKVTPFAGVWIEICTSLTNWISKSVTPFAGVWIEIRGKHQKMRGIVSLPSRECGLKYVIALHERKFFIVTPFAGVWIEIAYLPYLLDSWHCHSLRGSVD